MIFQFQKRWYNFLTTYARTENDILPKIRIKNAVDTTTQHHRSTILDVID